MTHNLTRRALLAAAPAGGIAMMATTGGGTQYPPQAEDGPFLVDLTNRPGDVALCYPCDEIVHALAYVTADGALIYGEGNRANLGDGWRRLDPGEIEVIGRVASLHSKDRRGWFTYGSGELAG
ncbi:hypothetical protein [Marinibacterium profundimaris]|uniref:Uncharacterized protein n=1 Tax=Marinibacterium profundimaris TaxID=1679460 RepID=A0A225NE21_9RHOB|nr:hypothetical protein [Marinibacterium profundimaris]OWU70511.1 hypothetical protein ATO3_19790 [Marinibacterium profundimaris]